MRQALSDVHDFEITLQGEGIDELTDEIVDAIYEAGCDDATLSSHGSTFTLTFHREARSYDEAVTSARADIARAGVGLAVRHVTKLATFSFEVILADGLKVGDGMAEAFARSDCDDAAVSLRDGTIVLRFDRLDESLGDAIGSAVRAVERAGFVVARIEVETV